MYFFFSLYPPFALSKHAKEKYFFFSKMLFWSLNFIKNLFFVSKLLKNLSFIPKLLKMFYLYP